MTFFSFFSSIWFSIYFQGSKLQELHVYSAERGILPWQRIRYRRSRLERKQRPSVFLWCGYLLQCRVPEHMQNKHTARYDLSGSDRSISYDHMTILSMMVFIFAITALRAIVIHKVLRSKEKWMQVNVIIFLSLLSG